MNHRERVRAALDFQRPDRLPCNESLWDGTLEVWQQQGMPVDTADLRGMIDTRGGRVPGRRP
jgi:hypothetical protein